MTSIFAIFQSYILCALIGFAFVYAFDNLGWCLVASFFVLMIYLDCMHPPAIMLPLIIIGEHFHNYLLAFNPIAIDALILMGAAYLFRKLNPL